MKATASILIILAFAGAACWLLASVDFIEADASPAEPPPAPEIKSIAPAEVDTFEPPAVEVVVPVDPIEERGDAMLFEIDALGGTPFDAAVVTPFD